jgi:hypothetical protein
MGAYTNRGKYRLLQSIFRRVSTPTGFYLAMVTGAIPPNADINTLAQLTDLPTANGYTLGGQAVARNATDFDSLANDTNTGFGKIGMKNFNWAASAGTIPGSGAEAEHFVLLDNNATPDNRDVLAWWDIGFKEWAGSGTNIDFNGRFMRLWDNGGSGGWTANGLELLLSYFFRGATMPSNFYVILLTDADIPDWTTVTVADITRIAAGNGYTAGGFSLTPNATDFDNLTENDANDRAELQLKDVAWTATGGPIPLSGSGASYAVLTDDHVTLASRNIFCWWDLGTARTATDGQQIILKDLEMRLTAQAAM